MGQILLDVCSQNPCSQNSAISEEPLQRRFGWKELNILLTV